MAEKAVIRPAKSNNIEWRRVLGMFKLAVPVNTKAALLPGEERLLSLMSWIGLSIPTDSRWFPVFQRYLDVLGGRVKQMGGDPGSITPDPNGNGVPNPDAELCFCGEICRILYNCEGCFEGFRLKIDDGQEKLFRCEGKRLQELVQGCAHSGEKVCVVVHKKNLDCIVRVEVSLSCRFCGR